MKVTINGNEKEVIVSTTYTRKIDCGYNDIILEWVKANPSQLENMNIEIDVTRAQKANDFLITEMTNLTAEELENMNMDDYNAVLQEVLKVKIPSEK